MHELQEIERIEKEAGIKQNSPKTETLEGMSASFMSESVYGKLNSPQARRRRAMSILLRMLTITYVRANSDSCATKTSRSWCQHPSKLLCYSADARLFKPIPIL